MLKNSVIEDDSTVIKHAHKYTAIIYNSSIERWAKRFIFTTHDGVDIYEDDSYCYIIHDYINHIHKAKMSGGTSTKYKYFSTNEVAQKYINDSKVKTLNDYENILLNDSTLVYRDSDNTCNNIKKSSYSLYLKHNDPKLYYTKVLELIATDLNDGWIRTDDNRYYRISHSSHRPDYITATFSILNLEGVKFKSSEIAKKAIKIMGDKLNIVFDIN
jgi:hypothetical protein